MLEFHFIVDDAFNCEWSKVYEGDFGRSLIVGAENIEVLQPRLIFN